MPQAVSEAFSQAQVADVVETKHRALLFLHDRAASREGGAASSSGDFSTAFPAAGAIDADPSHLKWGLGGGWKSDDGSASTTKIGPGWGGTGSQVTELGRAIELAFNVSASYEQDFDPLNTAPLVGQDGWFNVSVTGGATINVTPTAAYGGQGKGVQIQTAGPNTARVDARAVTFGTKTTASFRFYSVSNGVDQNSVTNLMWYDSTGAAYRFALRFPGGDHIVQYFDGAAWRYVDTMCTCPIASWCRFVVEMDRTTPASTIVKVFRYLPGFGTCQILGVTLNTTGINQFRIQTSRAAAPGGDIDQYLEDLRFGSDVFYGSGTQENVIDWGATALPAARARLTASVADVAPVSRQIAGAVYPLSNFNLARALRVNNTQTEIANTITPTESAPLVSLYLRMYKVGAPVGNMWVEIQTVSGGTPTGVVLARSRLKPVEFLSSTTTSTEVFIFPIPFQPVAGVQYAFVLKGDFTISATNYVMLWTHNAGTYTGGTLWYYDATGPGWVQVAAHDVVFVFEVNIAEETQYGAGNQDATFTFKGPASGSGVLLDATAGVTADVTSGAPSFTIPSFPVAANEGRLLVVKTARTSDGGGVPTSVVRDGQDFTRLSFQGDVILYVDVWYLVEPNVGAATITVTTNTSSGTGHYAATAESYYLVDQADPLGTAVVAAGVDAAPTLNVTAGNGDLVTDVCGVADAYHTTTLTVGPGQTQLQNLRNAGPSYDALLGASIEAGAGTVTMSWSLSAANVWRNIGVAIHAAGGTGELLVSMGYKVPYSRDVEYFSVYVKAPAGAAFTSGDVWWAEIHADDGQGRPSNSVLRSTTKARAYLLTAGGSYQWWILRLTERLRHAAGTQYHLALKGSWVGSATKRLDVGYDASSPTYADGTMCAAGVAENGLALAETWYKLAGDMCFGVLAETAPFVQIVAAYSTDGIAYTADQVVSEDPSRDGQTAAVDWTGERKRYWRVRAHLIRTYGGHAANWTPGISSWTVKLFTRTEKYLAVDFGAAADFTRPINMVELGAHPYEAGNRRFRIEYKTTDAGSWTAWTDPDMRYSEAQKLGGDATLSFDAGSGEFTTDGDAARILFSTLKAITDLRVVVLDTVDGFARVLYLKALRYMDISDRWKSPAVAQPGDFTLLRVQARTLTVTLTNADGMMSPEKRTDDSDHYEQLGGGCRIQYWVGHRSAPDWVPQGLFYVDKWAQASGTPARVLVNATDGVKLLKTSRRPEFQVAKTCVQLIEYLANLAHIPSTSMILDEAANLVDYFAKTESVELYQTVQELATAMGNAMVFFDERGRLVVRCTGSTGGDLKAKASFANLRRLYGPIQRLGDRLYCLGIEYPGATSDLRLYEFDRSTRVWTNRGLVVSHSTVGTHGGVLIEHDGRLFVLDDEDMVSPSGRTHRLYEWDGSSTFSLRARWYYSGAGPFDHTRQTHYYFKDGEFFFDSWTGGNRTVVRFNMLTFQTTEDNLVGPAVAYRCSALVKLNGLLYVFDHNTSSGNFELRTYDPYSSSGLDHTALAVQLATGYALARAYGAGADEAADSIFYVPTDSNIVITAYVGQVVATWSGSAYTYAVTRTDEVSKSNRLISLEGDINKETSDNDAMVVTSDYVLGAYSLWANTSPRPTSTRRLVGLDRESGVVVDFGPLNISCNRASDFRLVEGERADFCYGFIDGLAIFEFQIRRRLAAQTTVQFEIRANGPDGLGTEASLEAGDARGGESEIVNTAIVKATPLVKSSTLEELWRSETTPWRVFYDQSIELPVELTDPADAPQQVVLTFSAGGAGTAYIDGTNESVKHHQQPRIVIIITNTGTLESVVVNGYKLVAESRTVAYVEGKQNSLVRYGVRQRLISNEFIYEMMAQAAIASSITQRMSVRRVRINNAKSLGLWNLQLFDRVRIVEKRHLHVDGEFYVASFSHDYEGRTTSMTVVAA